MMEIKFTHLDIKKIDRFMDCVKYLSADVMQQMIDIFAFPDKLGWRSLVNLLSRNETCVPGCDSAWITRLKDKRL